MTPDSSRLRVNLSITQPNFTQQEMSTDLITSSIGYEWLRYGIGTEEYNFLKNKNHKYYLHS
jgi:hypothetical protein